MDKSLQIQLGRYASIAGAILVSNSAEAQEIYTDVFPDIAINWPVSENFPYALDLNGDGITDFKLVADVYSFGSRISSSSSYSSWGRDIVGIAPVNSNEIKTLTIGSVIYPHPLAHNFTANQLISDTLVGWSNDTNWVAASFNSGCQEHWPLNQDFFAAVRFKINNQWHYGWLRMVAISCETMVLKDYAYEATPDTPILSRDFNVGLQEQQPGAVHIKQNGNNFTVSFNNPHEKIYSVKNILGQEIFNASSSGNVFDFSIPDKGIFIVEVISNGSRYTKKIFVY